MEIPLKKFRLSCFTAYLPLVFALLAPGKIRGLDVTRAGLEGAFIPEYNKSFSYCWNVTASGLLELNGRWTFSAGLSAGRIRNGAGIGTFAAVEYGLPFFGSFFPLYAKISWMSSAVFETVMHTFLPSLSLRWRYFGFTLGPALRFTSFGSGAPPLFERNPAYLVYANFYNAGQAAAGMEFSNVNDFTARNLGAFSVRLRNRFRVIERISISCAVEAVMSGNTAHIVSVYGMVFREGVIFTW